MSGIRGRSGTDAGLRGSRAFRRGLMFGCFLLAGGLILGKAVKLQVVEHDHWVAAAEDQHRERVELPARRGAIYDRKGVPLALSHETYQVSVAPRELRDPAGAARALTESLGIARRQAEEAVRPGRSWVVLPGRYTAEQRGRIGSVRGIHFERQFDRFYPRGDAGREVVGAVTRDGRALGGIEQQLDDMLRGGAGYTILRRDARGELQPAISLPVVQPRDGASVHLTIDADLQEIADGVLREAMEATGSNGGDLLIGDPRTGEVLAAVSRRGSRTRSLTAITEPYEPGSTLKPFLVATLLAERRATLSDTIFAEDGTWQQGGRTFRDMSPHGWVSLGAALQVSSNIALVKFGTRISPGQQYAYLRAFGFGTSTGVEYPAESAGRLHRPSEWSRLSAGSLAMGYEISVTPLQMLAAYGALANGGVLMEPHLVREIRGPGGQLLEGRRPREVRRVLPEEVARAVTEVLAAAVEEGTGSRASLATFAVAGKTGTSRRTSGGGGYEPGAYTSTFVGYFPAQDPQIVIFVKLDEPQGQYYGGLTAAPVTREALQAMLAARASGLDGRALLAARGEPAPGPIGRGAADSPPPAGAAGTYVFFVADGVPEARKRSDVDEVEVPRLDGLMLREAARRAHAAGLRVEISGSGRVQRSNPVAGTSVPRGGVVELVAGGGP